MSSALWSSATSYIDDLIKEYLIKRAFINTSKAFEAELKLDKDKGFRAEKVVQLIFSFISNYDIDSLRAYWKYLEARIFCTLEKKYISCVKKLEYGLCRFYLVYCIQGGKKKECLEFFEKYQEFHGLEDWKEWFVLPYVSHPDQHKTFSMYFNKTWIDSFFISLQNFISMAFSCQKPPQIVKTIEELKKEIKSLKEENSILKMKLVDINTSNTTPKVDPIPNYVLNQGQPSWSNKNEICIPQKKKLGFNLKIKSSSKQKNTKAAAPTTSIKKQVSVESLTHSSTGIPQNYSNNESEYIQTQPQNTLLSNTLKTKKKSDYEQQRRELFGAPTKSRVNSLLSSNFDQLNLKNGKENGDKLSPEAMLIDKHLKDKPFTSGDKTNSNVFSNLMNNEEKSHRNKLTLISKEMFHVNQSKILQCKCDDEITKVACIDADNTIKIFNLSPNVSLLNEIRTNNQALSLCWYPRSSTKIFVGFVNGLVSLFQTDTKVALSEGLVIRPCRRITEIRCHPRPSHVAMICSLDENNKESFDICNKVLAWTLVGDMTIQYRTIHTFMNYSCTSLLYDGSGDYLITSDSSGKIFLFDSATSILVRTVQYGESIGNLSIKNDNSLLFAYSLTTGKIISYAWPNLILQVEHCNPNEDSLSKETSTSYSVVTPCGKFHLRKHNSKLYFYSIDKEMGEELVVDLEERYPITCVEWKERPDCVYCIAGTSNGKICLIILCRNSPLTKII